MHHRRLPALFTALTRPTAAPAATAPTISICMLPFTPARMLALPLHPLTTPVFAYPNTNSTNAINPMLMNSAVFTTLIKKYGSNGMMPPRMYAIPSVTAEIYGRLSGGSAMLKWCFMRKSLSATGELARWSWMIAEDSSETLYCWKCEWTICDVSLGEYLINVSHIREVAWYDSLFFTLVRVVVQRLDERCLRFGFCSYEASQSH